MSDTKLSKTEDKEKGFNSLSEKQVKVEGITKPRPTVELLSEYYNSLGDGTLSFIGIETGLTKLDTATLGLDGLVVLGGIAGKGKTSLALQLAFDACEKGTPVLFYSLEMPRRAIYTKILNRLSQVEFVDILLKGKPYLLDGEQDKNLFGQDQDTFKYLKAEEVERLQKAKEKLASVGHKFYVVDRTDEEATAETIEQDINLVKAEHKTDKVFVIIDHLQIANLTEYTDLKDKIDKLMSEFKGINERTKATILLISQKNRSGYHSTGLESLMGSAGIEYTADIVMLLDTQKEKEAREQTNNKDQIKGVEIDFFNQPNIEPIDLVVVKNRYNCPTKIELDFEGRYSQFKQKT